MRRQGHVEAKRLAVSELRGSRCRTASFQLLMNGCLEAIRIQLAVQTQTAIDGNQRGNEGPALDEVISLTSFFVIGGHQVYQVKLDQSRITLLQKAAQLLNLFFEA